ncbi:DivIVA domain-containing protein [Actinopolyspora mzabensis]|uniref:DivIVA domain-containing protein n=1 Tax=Actinopolyspora mzabensis TaxID=995066 RepID=A0A1G8VX83_ACTMZ|nr:DivIVA domain-containing protein [Actinopolyspora mzabensis]SDJ70437.1 DivIVA domain-containing protein [Actinopolyspora mzabensis]
MASALIYVVIVLAVAAVVYLLAVLVFGRGEELEPLPPGATPTRLPPPPVTGQDVRSLRFQQVFRGYKASEVDWALERLADELDDTRQRVAVLEQSLREVETRAPRDGGSERSPGEAERVTGETGRATGEAGRPFPGEDRPRGEAAPPRRVESLPHGGEERSDDRAGASHEREEQSEDPDEADRSDRGDDSAERD